METGRQQAEQHYKIMTTFQIIVDGQHNEGAVNDVPDYVREVLNIMESVSEESKSNSSFVAGVYTVRVTYTP